MATLLKFLKRRAVKKVVFGESLKPKSLAKGFVMASILSAIRKKKKRAKKSR